MSFKTKQIDRFKSNLSRMREILCRSKHFGLIFRKLTLVIVDGGGHRHSLYQVSTSLLMNAILIISTDAAVFSEIDIMAE